MCLSDHLREVGVRHQGKLTVGSPERVSGLTVFLEGPITGDVARDGSWRGVLDAFPRTLLLEEIFTMTLEDGRQGKIKIISFNDEMAVFNGLGQLIVPPSPEDEEGEILRILEDIHRNNG